MKLHCSLGLAVPLNPCGHVPNITMNITLINFFWDLTIIIFCKFCNFIGNSFQFYYPFSFFFTIPLHFGHSSRLSHFTFLSNPITSYRPIHTTNPTTNTTKLTTNAAKPPMEWCQYGEFNDFDYSSN